MKKWQLTLVVGIVLGLLAIIGLKVFVSLRKDRVSITKNQFQVSRTNIWEVNKGLDLFYVDCGFNPTTEQGLKALVKKPEIEPLCEAWGPPYVKGLPVDKWNNPIIYELDSHGNVQLRTLGRDGRPGGKGLDADEIMPDGKSYQVF